MKKLLISLLFTIISVNAQSTIVGYEYPDGVPVNVNKPQITKQAATGGLRVADATIPHLAVGGTWSTTLVATNVSSLPAKTKIEVFDPNGNRMSLVVREEKTGAIITGNVFTLVLPVHGTTTLTLLNINDPGQQSQETRVGWLRYEYVSKFSDANYGGYIAIHAIFRQKLPGIPDKEAVVMSDWGLDETIIAPFDNMNGFVTSMAIANGSSYSNNKVIIEIFDENGALISTYVENYPVGKHTAFETTNKWPETRNRRGTIKLSSTGYGIATVSLLFNPTGSLTSSQFYSTSGF